MNNSGMPVPEDDGAGAHLAGRRLPRVALPASDGRCIRLDELSRAVVFVYPGIGGPGREDLLGEWTSLPGARGCTSEACSFSDDLSEYEIIDVQVFGLSTQSPGLQREHARELALSYPLLSDQSLQLRETLALPTFDFHGRTYFKRITLIVSEAMIDGALYPVFPPEEASARALRWLSARA